MSYRSTGTPRNANCASALSESPTAKSTAQSGEARGFQGTNYDLRLPAVK